MFGVCIIVTLCRNAKVKITEFFAAILMFDFLIIISYYRCFLVYE